MRQKLLVVTDDTANGGTAYVFRHLASQLASDFDIVVAAAHLDRDVRIARLIEAFELPSAHYDISTGNFHQQTFAIAAAMHLLQRVLPDAILCVDSSLASCLALKNAAAQLSLPYVAVVNARGEYPIEAEGPFREKIQEGLTKASALIFVSAELRSYVAGIYPEIKPRCHYVENCCDAAFFERRNQLKRQEIRRRYHIDARDVLCITVSRINSKKGHLLVLRALDILHKKFPDCNLKALFVGPATHEALVEVSMTIDRFGLQPLVILAGERSDIADLLDASDVFVLASYSEGMSISITEAMAKGVPVVASAVGGIPDQIDDDCGVLLPSPVVSEAACVERLAQVFEQLRHGTIDLERMRSAARARALALFDPRTNARRYRDILRTTFAAPRQRVASSPPDAPALKRFDALDFRQPERIWNYLGAGWAPSEARGIWTDGNRSILRLRFAQASGKRMLHFRLKPFIRPGRLSQCTHIFANGHKLGSWRLTARKWRTCRVALDLDAMGALVELRLEHENSVAPAAIGFGLDERQLALFVQKLHVAPTWRIWPFDLAGPWLAIAASSLRRLWLAARIGHG